MYWIGLFVLLSIAVGAESRVSSQLVDTAPVVANDAVFDSAAEEDDEDYFSTPSPKTWKPTPLGVGNGIIADSQITVSTFVDVNTAVKVRSSSGGGWIPQSSDKNPWIRIDLGKVKEIHGIGTLGHHSQRIWVTGYSVYISVDGLNYKPLLNKITGKPRTFVGNSDQETWKNHCLHLYYGIPPKARFVEFRPLTSNSGKFGMRVEVYGVIDAEDFLTVLQYDVWTRNTTGCPCKFNPKRFDCACCYPGASQCPINHKHQCVKSGTTATDCGTPDVRPIRDPWTIAFTDGRCYLDPSKGNTCAKCATGGCQCPMNPNQCIECGHTEACGQKESVFGINLYCDVSAACVTTLS